ncbi:hypothetical protein DIPPA_05930 [Diplonema papillatum]|nr:hypothetical protein DIPPA_05930 [Diplonema papillatum]
MWESALLLVIYGAYVLFMSKNVSIYSWARDKIGKDSSKVVPEAEEGNELKKQASKTDSFDNEGRVKPKATEKEGAGAGALQERTRARSCSTSGMLCRQKSATHKKEVADTKEEQADEKEGEEEENDEGWSPHPPSEGLVKWLLLFPLNFILWLALPSGDTLSAEKEMEVRNKRIDPVAPSQLHKTTKPAK